MIHGDVQKDNMKKSGLVDFGFSQNLTGDTTCTLNPSYDDTPVDSQAKIALENAVVLDLLPGLSNHTKANGQCERIGASVDPAEGRVDVGKVRDPGHSFCICY